MDVKLNRTVYVCLRVCVQYLCSMCASVHLSVTGPHNRFIISSLKREKKTDSGCQLSVAEIHSLCVCVCVCAGTPLCVSTCVHLRVWCLPLCCLIAILSAGNQCAAHCRNGLSNFPVSGQPRYNGFAAKCLSCHQRTARQPGRLNTDR